MSKTGGHSFKRAKFRGDIRGNVLHREWREPGKHCQGFLVVVDTIVAFPSISDRHTMIWIMVKQRI